MSKKKIIKTDGLGPLEIKRIRSALRLVWHRCYARALVVKRATGPDGFAICELCKKQTPKLKIDHIKNVGDVDGGFIARLFVPSSKLQALCDTCHKIKTRSERTHMRETKNKKKFMDSF